MRPHSVDMNANIIVLAPIPNKVYDSPPMTNSSPLAFRVRPQLLDDYIGQQHIVGKGTPLRTAIEHDALTSVIFAGPPGTGKTTLAKIIANTTKAEFVQLNAVTSGVADLKQVCSEAERMKTNLQQRTVLFIDEIHRFNKAQQDALLPYVESGAVILIGATTENPYFEVNAALVSRSQVHLLKPLETEDIISILRNAVHHEHGFHGRITIKKDALAHLATISNGDARIALNALEMAVLTAGKNLTKDQLQHMYKETSKRYDKSGEDHYNTISAFIKTLRGSDVDAALVWLFKMIASGEEPRFLFRRMAIFASEDIGNADPRALQIVMSAQQAFEFVGLPEGEFFLTQACIYLAQAPKSNAVLKVMKSAKKLVNNASTLEVPNHLRNAPIKGMKEQGYGDDYQYPHDAEEGIVPENYFPIGMDSIDLYQPSNRGFEVEVSERMERAKQVLRENTK